MINLQHHFHQLECSISHNYSLSFNNNLFKKLIVNNIPTQKLYRKKKSLTQAKTNRTLIFTLALS